MEQRHPVEVEVIQMISPGCYLVKEKGPTLGSQQFDHLCAKMNAYFNGEAFIPRHVTPAIGMCYVGRERDKWLRVRVDQLVQRRAGPHASCYLLDYGTQHVMIPYQWLRVAEQQFFEVPFQVKECVLHNVHPITLVMDIELNNSFGRASKWDESSCAFMRDVISKTKSWKAIFLREKEGKYEIQLFAIDDVNVINISELLVSRNFAAWTELSSHVKPTKSDLDESSGANEKSPETLDEARCEFQNPSPSSRHDLQHTSPSPDARLYSTGRGSLLKNVMTSQPVPLVGVKSKSSPEKESPVNDSVRSHSSSNTSPIGRGFTSFDVDRRPSPITTQASQQVGLKSPRDHEQELPLTESSKRLSGSKVSPVGQGWGVASPGGNHNPSPSFGRNRLSLTSNIAYTSAGEEGIFSDSDRELRPSRPDSAVSDVTRLPRSIPSIADMDVESRFMIEKALSQCKLQLSLVNTSPVVKVSPENPGVQTALRSRLPKHLRSEPQTCSGKENNVDREQCLKNSSVISPNLSEFVVPNISDVSGLQKVSPLPNANISDVPGLQKVSPLLNTNILDASGHQRVSPLLNTNISDVSRLQKVSPLPSTNISDVPKLQKVSLSPSSDTECRSDRNVATAVNSALDSQSPPLSTSGLNQIDVNKERGSEVSPDEFLLSNLPVPVVPPTGVKQLTAEDMEVLYDGCKLIKPVTDVNSQPFIDLIRNTPGLYGITRPTKLQSICWPAVMRGLDVLGISPSKYRDGNPGGKTLSYLLPIISLLNFRSTYKDLPKYSTSPYVLILCPTWNKVLNVYDQCRLVLSKQHELRLYQIKLRVHLLFGGGGDDNQEVNMINGCEILVCTPHSFLRMMMDKKLTNLSRVCHLVLEDVDILMAQFKPELDQLMAQYKLELKERPGGSVPQQILMFSQRWSHKLKEFSLENQVCPVVVVTTKFESAHYGRVKQKPIMCLNQHRCNQLFSILESRKGKVVVFTSSSADAIGVYEILRVSTIVSLLAHDEMDNSELVKVSRSWNLSHRSDSQPVLVVTDSVLSSMEISDACWVIHLDVPLQLEVFADRLWCLRKYFDLYQGENKIESDECVSFIIITEECESISSRLIQVLQRCGEPIPKALAAMSEKHMEAKEQGKRSQLCHSLKSFGLCRNQAVCQSRHKVFSSLDCPGLSARHIKLPTEGTIKVWIRHFVDASCFYVHLLEHRDINGHATNFRSECSKLSTDMAFYFSRPSNRCGLETAENGELYAMQDTEHIFHRVEVLKTFTSETANYPDMVEVFMVDIGQTIELRIAELYELPSHLAEVPYQAVEVFICRIKPVDRDLTWTDKARVFLEEKILNQRLDGNIVLSLGNSLWLDPLQNRVWLPSLKTWQIDLTAHQVLLNANYAVKNPKHLELLYKACEGAVQLPSGVSTDLSTTHAYAPDGRLVSTRTQEFPEDRDIYHEVYVTAVKSPDVLYVQLAAFEKELSRLNEDINRTMLLAEDLNIKEPKKGLLVLARDPITMRWLRGRIETVSSNNLLEIFFVDTGVTDDLSLGDVALMPVHFKQFPFQAIECSLMGLQPRFDTYLDKCADVILDLTGDAEGKTVKVQALVLRKAKARYSGQFQYGINLYNFTTACYHVNIASQLVVEKEAKLSSEKLKELYPLAYDDSPTSSIPHQIAKVCVNILDAGNKETVSRLASELEELTKKCCSGDDSRIGLVAVVGQTLEYTWEDEAARAILLSLHMLSMGNPSHCDELTAEKIWDVLCHLLAKDQSNCLLGELMQLFDLLLSCESCCQSFIECGGLWYLANQNLCLSQLIQSQCELVLKTLLNTTDSRLSTGHEECLKAAVRYLCHADEFIATICLDILDHLIFICDNYKDDVRKHQGIKVLCERSAVWSEKTVLCKALNLLSKLTVNNRFNRDEIAKWYSPVPNAEVSDDPNLLELHQELIQRIQRSLPVNDCGSQRKDMVGSGDNSPARREKSVRREPIHNQPIPKEILNMVTGCRRPFVKWTQSPWNVLLTVEVKDTNASQKVATFTESTIYLRAVALSVEYSFSCVLYELIVPELCETRISAGCIYIGLKKKSRGVWPRLLRDKQANCSYISIDFNRFDDSSDDDTDREEDEHRSPLSLVRSGAVKSYSMNIPRDETVLSQYANATPDLACPTVKTSSSDDLSSSNSDSDDEFGAKFDPRIMEDSNLGYHVV